MPVRNLAIGTKVRPWLVWMLRIIVGATFIMSGFVKSVDLWGFTFKIEEYFLAWNLEMPFSLYVMSAMAISVSEFMLGSMLLIGSYRRSVPWLLMAMMVVMLPLTLYIYIADPVADCGCFGDFLVISNGATFIKNLFLTAAIVCLIVYNKEVRGLYMPYLQWIPAAACAVYVIAVGLYGYNVQPLLDFRSFPVGTDLTEENSENGEDAEFEFVYEKNGQKKVFSDKELPDSTWTFVDRKLVSGSIDNRTELTIYDGGADVTYDVISDDGPQMLIVVPDRRRVNISYTYSINELQYCMDSIGGSLIEIAAMPEEEIARWRDLSMATYPIYQSEPTVLKELARGVAAAVYLEDGKIIWKRSLPSIDVDRIRGAKDSQALLENIGSSDARLLSYATLILLGVLALVLLIENIPIMGRLISKMSSKNRKTEKN